MQEVKTILAVDDDITILTQIRTFLEGAYDISLAKNIEIAKNILSTTKVDLILLDLNMPGESGLEFLKAIQKDSSSYHIPVIIVSGQGTTDAIIDAKKNGVSGFVVKPISSSILMEKIRAAFKTARNKISRDLLIRRLKNLENACTTGKSGQAEETTRSLELVYYDLETDAKIIEICKFVKEMEYSLADENIKRLLTALSD
ncbi:MAG: response regulator [Leptospirales bacterium]|nr:response regulator [Leptospirales bacterium]